MKLLAILGSLPFFYLSQLAAPVKDDTLDFRVVTHALETAPKVFPDMAENYNNTVVAPREAALEAQRAAEEAARVQTIAEAVVTPPTPQIALVAPTSDAKLFIYMHESGNNPGSINASSGACGLGQALPCSKMPCSLSDYACQDTFFTGYMLSRYGSWEAAQSFWLGHSWW